MSAILAAAVGLAAGVLSGCGVGGGSLLLLYLTLAAGMEQYQAAGVNLLYFLACAPAALHAHRKHRLLEPQAVRWCILAGIPAAAAASLLASAVPTGLLRRLFGVLLLVLGLREVFARPETR